MKAQQRWQDWLTLLLGLWLIVAPFFGIGAVADVAAWSSYLSGTAVVIFAVAALARPKMWEEYINLGLGVWLILAPFVLGFSQQIGPTWNSVIVGLVVAGDAISVALHTPRGQTGQTA